MGQQLCVASHNSMVGELSQKTRMQLSPEQLQTLEEQGYLVLESITDHLKRITFEAHKNSSSSGKRAFGMA